MTGLQIVLYTASMFIHFKGNTMQWLTRLQVGQRLGLAFSLLVVLIIGVAITGFSGARSTFKQAETIYYDGALPLAEMGDMNYLVQRNRIATMDMLLRPEPAVIADRKAEIVRNTQQIEVLWGEFNAHNLSAEQRSLGQQFHQARVRFVQEGLEPTLRAIEAGNIAQARSLYDDKISVLAPEMQSFVSQLVRSQVQSSGQNYQQARGVSQQVSLMLLVAAILATLFAVWVGWIISRSITRPVAQAVSLAESVAAGDLTRRVHVQGRDELAKLLGSLNGMSENLARIVSDVRSSSENVATGSTQIAAGTIDLSQRTEQQAASLEETASAMEELSATVRNNAETAREARDLAEATRSRATEGGQMVANMVQTMQDISASSKKIAEIISVIDGIAFQTNILALNAAVEAARAGEQGRGFAVVASEVRTLAQRSALAAREIKDLIDTSVQKVLSGEAQVQQTGNQVAEIISQVRHMADLINDISAASAEQATGIGEVDVAVGQLDQVTQQNAALVAENSAAAESLREQATQLKTLVSVFQVSVHEAGANNPDAAIQTSAVKVSGFGASRLGVGTALPQLAA